MFSNSFIHLINKPIRVIPKTATLKDNIFTKEYKNENKYLTGIFTTDISDHYPIFHIAPFENKPQDNYHLMRLINSPNLEKYINAIQDYDWSRVNHYASCQTAFSHFSEAIRHLHAAFPIIKVKQRYRNRLPWLTDGPKDAIDTKTNSIRFIWNMKLVLI